MKKLTAIPAIIFLLSSHSFAASLPPLTKMESAALHTALINDAEVALDGGKSIYDYGVIYASANDMQRVYSANEVKGDRIFKGRKVAINGVVESITSGVNDVPVVGLETDDRIRNVNLEFAKKYEDIAVDLFKGQTVSFVCIGGTVIMGFPSVNECEPLKSAGEKLAEEKLAEIEKELSNGEITDIRTLRVIPQVKMYTKSSGNYTKCKPSELTCLTRELRKYMSENPNASAEVDEIIKQYKKD
ncbi:TPA: hypothetical protein OT180_002226 [Morganella morganii]|nr:hypothetical protein [Morganella morganii]